MKCVVCGVRERERAEEGGGGHGGGEVRMFLNMYTQRKMSVQKSSIGFSQVIWHTIKITVICL